MIKFQRGLIITSVFAFLMMAGSAWAQESPSAAEALKITRQQKMLSQAITKAYIAKSAKIKTETAHTELDDCLAQFEENTMRLEDFAKSGDNGFKSRFEDTEKPWAEFRMLAMSVRNYYNPGELYLKSELLFDTYTKLEKHLKGKVKEPGVMDKVEKQAMLTQRLSMLYLAYSYLGPQSRTIREYVIESFDDSAEDYKKAFKELEKTAASNDRIYDALLILKTKWPFPNKSLKTVRYKNMQPEVVYTSMNRLHKRMGRIVGLYEQTYGVNNTQASLK